MSRGRALGGSSRTRLGAPAACAWMALAGSIYLLALISLGGLVGLLAGWRALSRLAVPRAPIAAGIDLALVALFGLQHSGMARPEVKRRLEQVVPQPAHRSVFVLATALSLGLLVGLWQPLPQAVWQVRSPVAADALRTLFALGWALAVAASFMIDHLELFGLRQVLDHIRGRQTSSRRFQARWAYRWVRHPIVTGTFFGLWATPHMSADHLLLAAALTAYMAIGVELEERALVREVGEPYRRYRLEVPRFFPRLRKTALRGELREGRETRSWSPEPATGGRDPDGRAGAGT